MEHINITFPEDLKKDLDREAKREGTKRSTLIQRAVKIYLKLKHRKTMINLLKEGYQEMSGESKKISDDFENLDRESLKYVD